jgi:hypothetical protein
LFTCQEQPSAGVFWGSPSLDTLDSSIPLITIYIYCMALISNMIVRRGQYIRGTLTSRNRLNGQFTRNRETSYLTGKTMASSRFALKESSHRGLQDTSHCFYPGSRINALQVSADGLEIYSGSSNGRWADGCFWVNSSDLTGWSHPLI